MELWAGVIGVKEDSNDYGLTPEIGWFVRQANEENENITRLIQQEKETGGIFLKEDELSEILCKLPSINKLMIKFKDEITLPDWFFTLKVDELILIGDELSDELKARIKETFQEYHIFSEERDNDYDQDWRD